MADLSGKVSRVRTVYCVFCIEGYSEGVRNNQWRPLQFAMWQRLPKQFTHL